VVSPAPNATTTTQPPLTINFAKSGKQLSCEPGNGNLLDFAESHGIVVNSGCRAGGCGSCQTTIIQGEVRYPQAPDFDPEPGTCLMCMATPHTDLTLAL
jgi:ferredoxin